MSATSLNSSSKRVVIDDRTALLLETIAVSAGGLLHDLLNPEPLEIGLGFSDAETQLRELRAAMPRRPLSFEEGLQLAERQASLLRWQIGRGQAPALPTRDLTNLPFLKVTARVGLAKSALVTKTNLGWVIVLNADESEPRRRFSLCHEIKHLLDDPFVDGRSSWNIYPAGSDRGSAAVAELMCDRFAQALLMPRVLIRRDWARQIQDPGRLAIRYGVVAADMIERLHALGLTADTSSGTDFRANMKPVR